MSDAVLPFRSAFSDTSMTVRERRASALKLCFISETLHAGVGRHIVDLTTALAAKGHEIHLVYSPIRTDERMLAAIQAHTRVRCHPIAMPRAIGWSDIAVIRAIDRYIRANGQFDIVHGHSSKGGGYARLLKLWRGGPTFYSPHAFITQSPILPPLKRIAYRAIEALLARVTNRIICTSSLEREHARSLHISGARLSLIVNGNSDAADAPPRNIVRQTLGISSDEIVVGFAGRMEDQKAPQRLIAAAQHLLPEIPNLTFVMIGDGSKRQYLEAKLRHAGLHDRVRWLGAVDARRHMPGFDMFVLTSLYEGCPYVLLEALYAGLPIVSTPVGGAHEIVRHGVNGFMVQHDAPVELREAIRRIACDTALLKRMAEASLKRTGKFTVTRMVNALEALYFDVVLPRASANKDLRLTASGIRPA